MNSITDEYRQVIRAVYGDPVADNLEVEVKEGWYYIKFNQAPAGAGNEWITNNRYRKIQLQTTIANLKVKAASR